MTIKRDKRSKHSAAYSSVPLSWQGSTPTFYGRLTRMGKHHGWQNSSKIVSSKATIDLAVLRLTAVRPGPQQVERGHERSLTLKEARAWPPHGRLKHCRWLYGASGRGTAREASEVVQNAGVRLGFPTPTRLVRCKTVCALSKSVM